MHQACILFCTQGYRPNTCIGIHNGMASVNPHYVTFLMKEFLQGQANSAYTRNNCMHTDLYECKSGVFIRISLYLTSAILPLKKSCDYKITVRYLEFEKIGFEPVPRERPYTMRSVLDIQVTWADDSDCAAESNYTNLSLSIRISCKRVNVNHKLS